MVTKVNLRQKLALFSDQWSPKVLADLNDSHVKVAKVQGEFVWHNHADEDELFLILHGRLMIELRDGSVTLEPGEFVVTGAWWNPSRSPARSSDEPTVSICSERLACV